MVIKSVVREMRVRAQMGPVRSVVVKSACLWPVFYFLFQKAREEKIYRTGRGAKAGHLDPRGERIRK